MLTNYARPETYLNGNVDFVNADNRHYQTNYACPLNEQYVPNNEIEITNEEKQVRNFLIFIFSSHKIILKYEIE